MAPLELLLLLTSISTSVAGQFLLKSGALKLGRINATNIVGQVFGIATTPELILGLACYGLGAVAYIMLLTRVKLSVAAPAVAMVYVFTVLMGYFLFREPIPMTRVVGMGFIVCGVLLVLWQK